MTDKKARDLKKRLESAGLSKVQAHIEVLKIVKLEDVYED